MPVYQYKAMHHDGKNTQGTLEADSIGAAKTLLRERNLIPLEFVMQTERAQQSGLGLDKHVSLSALSLFTQEFAALINAGLEIEESLRSLSISTENKILRNIVLSIHTKILEGESLSQSMQGYSKAFPELYRVSINAGEKAGSLGEVLNYLSHYLNAQKIMMQKLQQAMIYPIILTFVSICIVVFLLTFVTPKITNIFADSDKALPFATVLLMGISDFLVKHALALLMGLAGIILAFRFSLKLETVRYTFQICLLRIPLLGKLIRQIQTSRFLKSLGIMLRARVPILDALSESLKIITVLPIHEKVQTSIQSVKEGNSLYASLKNTGYFTPVSLQFIASGEKTGSLDQMLLASSEHQENQIQNMMNVFVTLFEPLVILLMGGFVLFIVLATLLPMFQMSNLLM